MFGSDAIEVGIGLALVFFVLATASSAVVELLASIFKVRAKHLKRSLGRLFAGTKNVPKKTTPDNAMAADEISPEQQNANRAVNFVDNLYRSSSIAPLAAAAKLKPSYIPAKNFAEGVLSIVRTGMQEKRGDAPKKAKKLLSKNTAALEATLNTLPDDLHQQLLEIAGNVGTDIVAIQAEIEDWFDSSMDRAAGVFARWSRWVLIVVAVVIVVSFNVDTVDIGVALWESEEARGSAVAAAEAQVKEAAEKGNPLTAKEALEQVGTLPVPVGWDSAFCDKTDCSLWDNVAGFGIVMWEEGPGHVFGWVITVLMVSLGAPFWYDAMNKLVSIRGAGGKPEKAGNESGSATSVMNKKEESRTAPRTVSDPLPSLAAALTPGAPD